MRARALLATVLAGLLGACTSRVTIPPPSFPLVATPADALAGPPSGRAPPPPPTFRIERRELGNGFRVFFSRGEPNGVVSVAFVSSATPRWDAASSSVVTQWMPHMTFRATHADGAVTDDFMQREGFSPDIETGASGLIVHDRVPREELPRWIRTLDQVLRRPAFREADLARRVEAHSDRVSGELAQSSGMLDDRLPGLLYAPGDPRAISARQRLAAVQRLDVATLRARHADLLDPSRGALVVVGDLDPEELLPLITERFGAWPAHPTTPQPPTPRLRRHGARGILVVRPTLRAFIRLVDRAPPFTHEDYAAFLVLEQILGGMFASRMNLSVREASGASYGFHARYGASAHEGVIEMETSIEPGYLRSVLVLVLGEVRRVAGAGSGIEQRELSVARTRARETLLARVDSSLGLAIAIARRVQIGQEPETFGDVIAAIDALSADDIEAAARRWLRPARATLLLVARPEHVGALRELDLGTLEVLSISR